MGSIFPNRVDSKQNSNKNSLLSQKNCLICSNNFRFISKIQESGKDKQSMIWLAENYDNSSQKFFIKTISKRSAFQNKRIQFYMNELKIYKNKGRNNFLVQPFFAFQDYTTLYLVTEYVQGFTLQEVLKQHIFTDQQAKYVITSLISIIQCAHQQKLALTQLSPKNIIIQKQTGRLKIFNLQNSLEIDSFYPSASISPLNQYCAPQILAMDQVLAQSDYYSLGLILYYIMKNKPAISEDVRYNRMAILSEKILVVKSDLPQGWKPDSADFLVKLLIKNPQLRLGRYGSFEISNHAWLQNFSWSINNDLQGISLVQSYFEEKRYLKKCDEQDIKRYRENINTSYEFQKKFQGYQFRFTNDEQTISYDSIQQQY